ncbi:MAG TPA: IS701 family transposase [Acidobacteriaceae bacterium]|nr:IS701 family transposase [Acidobacteriaceae bacterium]HVX11882.1 IS701 family transposase [Pirellulales bacterium]
MTEQEIAGLSPAFAAYLGRYRGCFLQKRTMGHFDTYCRGLLSDLPRKSVEPIALEAGTAVRTLQEFLVTARWDHEQARDQLQQNLAAAVGAVRADELGTIGVIDETSCQKWGDHTPGVQRQYLGCVGKVDNGIVTVHVAVAKGRFQALLDADLYLPKVWDEDRARCEAAGIPAHVRYRPKWHIALDELIRLERNGLTFDWLVFDEGYGAAVPFLWILNLVEQRFVAEVPVNFVVRARVGGKVQRANERLTVADAKAGQRYRLAHRTVPDSVWRASSATVWVAGRQHVLIVAINEATAEVKYFLTNATGASVAHVLKVAFRRWTVEHAFRLGKQEAGLMHYEGRNYTGLMRHLILALLVLGFVATHTERLRGEKSKAHGGTSVPGPEPSMRDRVSPSSRHFGETAHEQSHLLPPEAKRAGDEISQEAAA